MSGRVMDKMVMLVWVYPIIKGLPLEVSVFEEDPQMAQMSSSFRIMPYSENGQNGHRWSVQQSSDRGPGTQRLIFQLQQDQGRHPSPTPQADVSDLGITGTKGSRLVRVPSDPT